MHHPLLVWGDHQPFHGMAYKATRQPHIHRPSTPTPRLPEGGVAGTREAPSVEGGVAIAPHRLNPLIVYNISCGHERHIPAKSTIAVYL